jgi:hypothetical protein
METRKDEAQVSRKMRPDPEDAGLFSTGPINDGRRHGCANDRRDRDGNESADDPQAPASLHPPYERSPPTLTPGAKRKGTLPL